jgi:hypothetical protein
MTIKFRKNTKYSDFLKMSTKNKEISKRGYVVLEQID